MAAFTNRLFLDQLSSPKTVRCKFDERTSIMHICVDGGLMVEEAPTDAEFMEIFAHQAKGAKIKGIVVFTGDRDQLARKNSNGVSS